MSGTVADKHADPAAAAAWRYPNTNSFAHAHSERISESGSNADAACGSAHTRKHHLAILLHPDAITDTDTDTDTGCDANPHTRSERDAGGNSIGKTHAGSERNAVEITEGKRKSPRFPGGFFLLVVTRSAGPDRRRHRCA